MINDAVLISLVEKYEELYNSKHSNYFHHQIRDNIWEEIGSVMNESGATCKTRWIKIRDNYRKALQLRKSKGEQTIKPPKFGKELKFLIPHLHEDRERFTSILSVDVETVIEELSQPLSPPESLTTSAQSDSQGPPSFSPICGSRMINSSSSYGNSLAASMLNEYMEQQSAVPNTYVSYEQDTLTGFFLNMAQTVKGFPIEEQIRIKNEVFGIVNETELRLAVQSNTAFQTPKAARKKR